MAAFCIGNGVGVGGLLVTQPAFAVLLQAERTVFIYVGRHQFGVVDVAQKPAEGVEQHRQFKVDVLNHKAVYRVEVLQQGLNLRQRAVIGVGMVDAEVKGVLEIAAQSQ